MAANLERKAALRAKAQREREANLFAPLASPPTEEEQGISSSCKGKDRAEEIPTSKSISFSQLSMTEYAPADGSCPLLKLPEELLSMVCTHLTPSASRALCAACTALNIFSHNHVAFPFPSKKAIYGQIAMEIYTNQTRRLKKHPDLAYLSRRKYYYLQQPVLEDASMEWSISLVDTLRMMWYDYPKANKTLRVRSCSCQSGQYAFNLRKEKYLGSDARISHEAWHNVLSFCRRCARLIWRGEILNVESGSITYTFSERRPGKGERAVPLDYGEQGPQAA